MRWIRFIGDVHGKFPQYEKLLGDMESRQVGDFGVGFGVPNPHVDTSLHKWIRGNHDDPDKAVLEPGWIKDGDFDGTIFAMGGAESTDRHLRSEGINWWPDEQLSYGDLWRIAELYEHAKPKVMISHDAPEPICHYMLGYVDWNRSRTKQALSAMFSAHKPKLWVFGHYHKEFDDVIEGTRFVCLPELGTLDIDVDAL